jgi:hypothetical protein
VLNIFAPILGGEGFGSIAISSTPKGGYTSSSGFYSTNSQLLYEDNNECRKLEHQKLESRIKSGFGRIESAKIPYDPLATNSNSAAFQVIRELGIVENLAPKSGVNPIGWDINPYTYWQPRFPTPQPGPKPTIPSSPAAS